VVKLLEVLFREMFYINVCPICDDYGTAIIQSQMASRASGRNCFRKSVIKSTINVQISNLLNCKYIPYSINNTGGPMFSAHFKFGQ
jgi:hypothetical protein